MIIYPNKYSGDNWKTTTLLSGDLPLFCPHDLRPDEPVSVAEAWNHLADIAFNGKDPAIDYIPVDYLIIANSDILFHPKAIDNLVKFAEEYPNYAMWTGAEWSNLRTFKSAEPQTGFDEYPHFSCFMINEETYNTIGPFDKNFKGGYCEDLDYHTRILLAGKVAAKTASAWFYHYGSRTIECDPELKKKNMVTHHENRLYFKEKWGVDGDGKGADKIYDEIQALKD